MDGGKFVTLVILIVVLIGGLAYVGNAQIQAMQDQIASLNAQIMQTSTVANDAKSAVAQTRTALDQATASLTQAGDLTALTKQAADSAAAAAKSAADAKAASMALEIQADAGAFRPALIAA